MSLFSSVLGTVSGTSYVKWGIYGAVGLAITGCVWFAYLWAYDRGVASQTAIVSQAKQTAVSAVDANQTNQATIAALRRANDACVASVAASTQKGQLLAQQLEQAKQVRSNTVMTDRQIRRVIYEKTPTLAACAAMALPDGIAKQLRQ